jgi:uncharacterized protein YdiU (UPF0061 family)
MVESCLKSALKFKNSILSSGLMRIDVNPLNQIKASVRAVNFSRVRPTPLDEPYIASVSQDCMKMIGLDPNEKSDQMARLLSGADLFDQSEPLAQNYCGYQFGMFSG